MTGIYLITNKVSGGSYVGKSVDIHRRFIEHRTVNAEHNGSLKAAFLKYGVECFSFEVLEECPVEMLNEREMYYIDKLNPSYNRTKGGDGRSRRLTPAEKEHLRQCGKRQWANMSESARETQIRNNLKGPKVGHPVSQETREKLRKANIGKTASPETIAKRKTTMAKKGIELFNGKRYMRPIRCIETGETLESLKEAEKKYGLTTLCAHLKGKYKTCKGLHYEYLSVETTRDECSGVGQKMSYCPKCAAHKKV